MKYKEEITARNGIIKKATENNAKKVTDINKIILDVTGRHERRVLAVNERGLSIEQIRGKIREIKENNRASEVALEEMLRYTISEITEIVL